MLQATPAFYSRWCSSCLQHTRDESILRHAFAMQLSTHRTVRLNDNLNKRAPYCWSIIRGRPCCLPSPCLPVLCVQQALWGMILDSYQGQHSREGSCRQLQRALCSVCMHITLPVPVESPHEPLPCETHIKKFLFCSLCLCFQDNGCKLPHET